MILKNDCRFFKGDRPCNFSKETGKTCLECDLYSKADTSIIIIKLDATGDVLRTTSILPALKKKYPNSAITWVTRKNALDIFKNNSLVDTVLAVEQVETLAIILNRVYDVLIHTDASPVSSNIAALVRADEKYGFIANQDGVITPLSDSASAWLEMGAFDKLKKANLRSYQDIIFEIAGLEFKGEEIQIHLTDSELEFAETFSKQNKLKSFKRIIGINTGAGARWLYKSWNFNNLIQLIKTITTRDEETGILLLGGPEEKERNSKLKELFPTLIDAGTENTLRQFFSLVNLCDVVLTGDTMALHTAAALQKPIVCLFGPTSINEIYDYKRIEKISSKIDCLVCYKQRCDVKPNCMELITSEMVYEEINKKLATLPLKS